MASLSHSRIRSIEDTPQGWTPLPGWYRFKTQADGWAEIWGKRDDGFRYSVFPYRGITRQGGPTTSFRVCRQRMI